MQIEHVAIWTRDLHRLKAFYQTYFEACPGEHYVNPRNRFESCFLEFASGARLELMTMPTIPDSVNDIERQFTGIIHLAFAAGSDENVEHLTQRLERDGYRVVDGPRRTGDGYYESVAFDPDGNRLEITV
jgi:lactoylglutathione lyase